jgi:hypothetical protein
MVPTSGIDRTCILGIRSVDRNVVAHNAFDIVVCGAAARRSLRRLEEGELGPLHVRKLCLVEIYYRRIHFECLVWTVVALREELHHTLGIDKPNHFIIFEINSIEQHHVINLTC